MFFCFAHRNKLILPTDEETYYFDSEKNFHFKDKYKYYPVFNSFVYSLEVFVPLVKLGLDDFWQPVASRYVKIKLFGRSLIITGSVVRWYWWGHIIAGWVLTTLWVAGLTGLAKS